MNPKPDMNGPWSPEIGQLYEIEKAAELAEYWVISGCLDARFLPIALKALRTEDFAPGGRYRPIFQAIMEVAAAGESVHIVSLVAKFPSMGNELARLDVQDTWVDFKSYVRAVKEHSRKRHLRKLGRSIESAALNGKTAKEILTQAHVDIAAVPETDTRQPLNLKAITKKHDGFVRQIRTGEIVPQKLPFQGLEAVLLYPGNTMVVGARTAVGKTAFAVEIALAASRTGSRVMFITTEMTEEEMAQRFLSSLASEGIGRLRELNVEIENHPVWVEFMAEVANAGGNLMTYYMPGGDEREVTEVLDTPTARGGVDILILDYIQTMSCSVMMRKERRHQIGYLSRFIKRVCGERSIVGVILSQLGRPDKLERQTKSPPTIWDLKEAGELENDADVVLLLHRTNASPDSREWVIDVDIAKNRHGCCGDASFRYDSRSAQWT